MEIVRQPSAEALELFKFNDMTDHDIDVSPGTIWEDIKEFNAEYFEGRMQLVQNLDKKYFKLIFEDEEIQKLEVKVTFLDLNEEDEDEDVPKRLRMRLVKKKGSLQKWYSILKDMQDTVFEDTLLAPRNHQKEILTAASDEEET